MTDSCRGLKKPVEMPGASGAPSPGDRAVFMQKAAFCSEEAGQ